VSDTDYERMMRRLREVNKRSDNPTR